MLGAMISKTAPKNKNLELARSATSCLFPSYLCSQYRSDTITPVKPTEIKSFQKKIWDFYGKNKREFPWRPPLLKIQTNGILDPYNIFISEVMLQQTQTYRVVPKYEAWIRQFPDFKSLSQSPLPTVLRYWSGLGYNRRALYIQTTAQRVVKEFGGKLPMDPEILETFPGIGKNTAGSIYVFSENKPFVFIETNIRRVFIHEFFSSQSHPGGSETTDRISKDDSIAPLQNDNGIHDRDILTLVDQTLDRINPRQWYYALMDYGSYLGKTIPNPNRQSKHYAKQSRFEGSVRQIRGKILKILLEKKKITKEELLSLGLADDEKLLDQALLQLQKEGFISANGTVFRLNR